MHDDRESGVERVGGRECGRESGEGRESARARYISTCNTLGLSRAREREREKEREEAREGMCVCV